MNARRTLVILGAICLLLIAAIVALSIFFHRKMEIEKNQTKTARARETRWRKTDEPTIKQAQDEEIKEVEMILNDEN